MKLEDMPTKEEVVKTDQEKGVNDNETLQTPSQTIESENSKESMENMPIDFSKEEGAIDSTFTDRVNRLEERLAAYDTWKEKLNKTYSTLGGTTPELEYPDQKHINELKEEVEQLKTKKQELKIGKESEEFLEILNKLPKSELKIIIETGKNSQGQAIQGSDGKTLKPEAAKSLAKLALDGILKLTKALLTIVFSVIGGVASGISEIGVKKNSK